MEWTGHERSSYFVTASDGVRLAVDVVLPAGFTGQGEAATAFPVIFRYTPYHRTSINPETGEVPVAPFEFFLVARVRLRRGRHARQRRVVRVERRDDPHDG